MATRTVQTADLKQIVHEAVGAIASHTLLKSLDDLLDKDSRDQVALRKNCAKIQAMVGLFIGTEKAQLLGKRFNEVFK